MEWDERLAVLFGYAERVTDSAWRENGMHPDDSGPRLVLGAITPATSPKPRVVQPSESRQGEGAPARRGGESPSDHRGPDRAGEVLAARVGRQAFAA